MEDDEARLDGDSHVAVIGAGHAGVQFAAHLRELGYDGTLTLIEEDGHEPYDRPSLSKEYLADLQSLPTSLRSGAFYERVGINIVSAPVTAIDRANQVVHAGELRVGPYTHLVLATGGRPNVLGIPGHDLDGVMSLRTLADASRLRERMAAIRELVVVGGGFIGLEIASAAAAHGNHVTVVEAAQRLLERSVSEEVSRAVLAHHEASGVDVILGRQVKSLVGSGGVSGVRLDDGSTVPADLVVVGVGMAPADRLAEESGLAVDHGVLVDASYRTTDPHISAIGDCAVVVSGKAGAKQRLESIPNAHAQAKRLAHRLMGLASMPEAIPWFWSHQGAFKLQIVGLARFADQCFTVGGEHGFSVVFFREGYLVAVESCNDAGTHMAGRRALESGEAVSLELCRVNDFDLRRVARTLRDSGQATRLRQHT